ncbi:hypothetical protein [Planobispora longispora]|uniref:Uncharacterized protein n=1 Tax=Planobispora longispora TaxID=28887 RepID=A0A8J3W5M3_9ACTN|nr:hypothetical protein [Planobispora longispora]GIH77629.1 hypothetical protein Plo01_40580 [Planobispora longispora]
MHVPPPPGHPEQPGEREILTGPAGGPGSRRKGGPAIAVVSVVAAALVGGGAVFAVMKGMDGDAAPAPQPPSSGQEAAPQNPATAEGESGEPEGKPSDPANVSVDADRSGDSGTADRSGGSDAADRSGGSGDGDTSGSGTGTSDRKGSGSGSDSTTPDTGKNDSGKGGEKQDLPAAPDCCLPADGPAGFVAPQGPTG